MNSAARRQPPGAGERILLPRVGEKDVASVLRVLCVTVVTILMWLVLIGVVGWAINMLYFSMFGR